MYFDSSLYPIISKDKQKSILTQRLVYMKNSEYGRMLRWDKAARWMYIVYISFPILLCMFEIVYNFKILKKNEKMIR